MCWFNHVLQKTDYYSVSGEMNKVQNEKDNTFRGQVVLVYWRRLTTHGISDV